MISAALQHDVGWLWPRRDGQVHYGPGSVAYRAHPSPCAWARGYRSQGVTEGHMLLLPGKVTQGLKEATAGSMGVVPS